MAVTREQLMQEPLVQEALEYLRAGDNHSPSEEILGAADYLAMLDALDPPTLTALLLSGSRALDVLLDQQGHLMSKPLVEIITQIQELKKTFPSDPAAFRDPFIVKMVLGGLLSALFSGGTLQEMKTGDQQEISLFVLEALIPISDVLTGNKAWECLPERLLGEYVGAIENIAEAITHQTTKRMLLSSVGEMKAGLEKAAALRARAQVDAEKMAKSAADGSFERLRKKRPPQIFKPGSP